MKTGSHEDSMTASTFPWISDPEKSCDNYTFYAAKVEERLPIGLINF